jgi:hypothetical protein
MRAQLNAGYLGEPEKIPMLRRLLQYKYSPGKAMPDHDIISELMGHMYVSISHSTVLCPLNYHLLGSQGLIPQRTRCPTSSGNLAAAKIS